MMLPAPARETLKTKKKKKIPSDKSILEEISNYVEVSNPFIADISSPHQVACKLKEYKCDTLATEKDYYLCYFLSRNPPPGRTLIFANSISCVKRIGELFTSLNFKIWCLHAKQQQRQRLKNLERFRKSNDGIVVCTDVAARGLDIDGVDTVVHYQLPRSSEVYIHRSGRTARAGKDGVSLALISEQYEDQNAYKKLCHFLNRPEGLESLKVNVLELEKTRNRVTEARKTYDVVKKKTKVTNTNNWFKKNAEAMELELDDDLLVNDKEGNQSD